MILIELWFFLSKKEFSKLEIRIKQKWVDERRLWNSRHLEEKS